MKLLIITQKVDRNDPILGFFHRWIEEFARNCEYVTVICLYKGQFGLPANVKVLSLGKERGIGKLGYVSNFYRYVWLERNNYDSVFVHMNQIYVLLGGLLWRLMGKKIVMWYAHGHTSFSLWVAEKLVDNIFSVSKESFTLKTNKLKIVGHGIDTNRFKTVRPNKVESYYNICSLARISERKNQYIMIAVLSLLKRAGANVRLYLVGPVITKADVIYKDKINQLIVREELLTDVIFPGNITQDELPSFLGNIDLLLNLSDTNSVDKEVLEAMSCGVNVLTSNIAFKDILPSENLTSKVPEEVTKKILQLISVGRSDHSNLRQIVEKSHNLQNLIKKIVVAL